MHAPRSVLLTGLLSLLSAVEAKNIPRNSTSPSNPKTSTYGQVCKVGLDFRPAKGTTPNDLDASNSIFQQGNVIGKNLTLSTEVQFSNQTSLFDNWSSLEVTIRDTSIFNPTPELRQTGFRRLELVSAANDGKDNSTEGIKTFHFSVKKDLSRPLNTSHEYNLVYLENAKFTNNMWGVRTGKLLDIPDAKKENLNVFGNSNYFKTPAKLLFSTPFTKGVFHNFAVRLDFTENTIQVYYSKGNDQLSAVTDVVENDLSGKGQYHVGIGKKPTDAPKDADISKFGYQPSNITESLIYGGVFLEDSGNGCITLRRPGKKQERKRKHHVNGLQPN